VKAVGVKRLKARLSEYIRIAKSGETVLVMERDQVVAELGPARQQRLLSGPADDVLDALVEAGEVTRAALKKGGWTWKTKGLGLPRGTATRLLEALRADRS
jgi:antitoxin (DNA-binding transcriptional repressor) of toxin-antitoxin stability system